MCRSNRLSATILSLAVLALPGIALSPIEEVGIAGGDYFDPLVDAAPVVREEMAGGRHDRDRASVVDLEGMVPGAGKVGVEVDVEPGVGTRISVDDLVVVTHSKDLARLSVV